MAVHSVSSVLLPQTPDLLEHFWFLLQMLIEAYRHLIAGCSQIFPSHALDHKDAILLMQIFPSSIPLWGQEVITRPKMASLIHEIDQIVPPQRTGASISKMVYWRHSAPSFAAD